MEQKLYEFSQDATERRVLDALSGPLSNGWSVTVHWDSRLADLQKVPIPEPEEKYLIWWESEKRKYIAMFVVFIETFGLQALLSAANVGKGDTFTRNIWFKDWETEEGLCFVKEIEIHISQKLIEIFISV